MAVLPKHSISHSESDVSLRLVEIWYDSTWAYLMSSHGQQMVKRVDNRRRHFSSSASVASSVAEASVIGKGMDEKLEALHENLLNVKERLTYKDFKDLCACCLKDSDRLYPGFKDIPLIVRYLLREDPAYKGALEDAEIERVTLAMIYQCIYQQLCEYLLSSTKGAEAMKLLTTPTKLMHATYDICRQKFCRILVDETEIIQYGLFRMIRKIVKRRESKKQDVETDEHQMSVDEEAKKGEEREKRRRRRDGEDREKQRLAAEEEERQRLAAEEEEKQRLAAEEEERQRLAAEEEERQRLAAEEEERQRLAAEEEERQRQAAEEEERQRKAAEEEEERQRLAAAEEDDDDDEGYALDMPTSERRESAYMQGPFFQPYGLPRPDKRNLPQFAMGDNDSVSSLEDDE